MIALFSLLIIGVSSVVERCDAQVNITSIQKPEILSVIKAATHLLSQRNSDYGWEDFTPRALIAMSFAEKILPIPVEEKILMKKRLDVHLLLNLRNGQEQKLANLAISINALYAMCQNPRNFHGMDLVGLLRSETGKKMKKNDFNLPLVQMTLCLARETNAEDADHLMQIYRKSSSDKIGFKALTVIAMSACMGTFSRSKQLEMKAEMNDFSKTLSSQYSKLDVYSKALVLQALSSLGYDLPHFREDLMAHQRDDGSFGNLLATYSAIPALLGDNLSNLMCERSYEVMPIGKSLTGTPSREMRLSIHNAEQDVTHSIHVPLDGNITFFDVMTQAAQRDYLYRFKYETCDLGKMVYSLSGIPNDAETGLLWSLYRGDYNSVIGRNGNLKREILGIEKIYPRQGEHFIFSMEH